MRADTRQLIGELHEKDQGELLKSEAAIDAIEERLGSARVYGVIRGGLSSSSYSGMELGVLIVSSLGLHWAGTYAGNRQEDWPWQTMRYCGGKQSGWISNISQVSLVSGTERIDVSIGTNKKESSQHFIDALERAKADSGFQF
jgi:hypothetical protein